MTKLAERATQLQLQFGHGIIAVENFRLRGPGRRATHRFNLATASSPWRTYFVSDPESRGGVLQFGHGIIAVENAGDQAVGLDEVGASIWPRHHRRGERGSARLRRRVFAGFNLATASSPWRTTAARSGEIRSKGFNLATASSPWRTPCGSCWPLATAEASIWPRHHRRGERPPPAKPKRTYKRLQFGHGIIAVENWFNRLGLQRESMLQFGHGIIAVENLYEKVDSSVELKLQFGHGIIAVENPNPDDSRTFLRRASIWPRHHRRGEPGEGGAAANPEGASIWPRHHRRGEQLPAGRPGRLMLRFNLATASSPWRTYKARSQRYR